jgi:hypothetical protein
MPHLSAEENAIISKRVFKYFKEGEYTVEVDPVIDEDDDEIIGHRVSIYSNRTGTELCVSVVFKNSTIDNAEELKIDSLNKCGISGSDTLSKIEKFAKSYPNIKRITLQDASSMSFNKELRMSFYTYYILHSGMSWYNSKGYYSYYFLEERAHNKIQIERPIVEFLKDCFNRLLKTGKHNKDLTDEKQQQLIEGIHYFYKNGDYESLSTTEFFNIVKRIIRKETNFYEENLPRYKWLEKIVNMINFSKILEYYPHFLSKTIERKSKTIERKSKTRKNSRSSSSSSTLKSKSNE